MFAPLYNRSDNIEKYPTHLQPHILMQTCVSHVMEIGFAALLQSALFYEVITLIMVSKKLGAFL